MTRSSLLPDPDALTTAPSDEPSSPCSSRAARTLEVERALAAHPDEERESDLRDQLIALHMGVAASIAGRYCGRGIALDDLQQVAYLALTKASRRYDASSGHAFMSLCVPTIRGEVRRHFRDHGWMVRPPRRVQELQLAAGTARSRMALTLGREPSDTELADELDTSISSVREADACRGAFAPDSLDHSLGSGQGSVLGDLLGGEDGGQPAAEARIALASAVRRLGARDRRILQLRFFDQLTQREIAQDIGVTQMQVSRLLSRIFRNLRDDVGEVDVIVAPDRQAAREGRAPRPVIPQPRG